MSTISASSSDTSRPSEAGSPVVGRFAPSPTGRMHAGNIFASLIAWLIAKTQGGRIVLRIEDLDRQRSKSDYIEGIMRDYERLRLPWDEGPFYQSARDEIYAKALSKIETSQEVYPCFCTRADLHAASAPHQGEHFVYPGTCRSLSPGERKERMRKGRAPALRLAVPEATVSFTDGIQGACSYDLSRSCGDFVIRRADGCFAYHLAVSVDDALQGVTSVVRGADLLSSTPQQIHLQRILGYSQPTYDHVPVLMGADGHRLSKRHGDASLESLLERYGTSEGIIAHIMDLAGFDVAGEGNPEELARHLTADGIRRTLQNRERLLWQA